MGLLFNHKKKIRAEKAKDANAYVKITAEHQKTHEAADKTNEEIKRLNELLLKNGITLNIHIATHGGKR